MARARARERTTRARCCVRGCAPNSKCCAERGERGGEGTFRLLVPRSCAARRLRSTGRSRRWRRRRQQRRSWQRPQRRRQWCRHCRRRRRPAARRCRRRRVRATPARRPRARRGLALVVVVCCRGVCELRRACVLECGRKKGAAHRSLFARGGRARVLRAAVCPSEPQRTQNPSRPLSSPIGGLTLERLPDDDPRKRAARQPQQRLARRRRRRRCRRRCCFGAAAADGDDVIMARGAGRGCARGQRRRVYACDVKARAAAAAIIIRSGGGGAEQIDDVSAGAEGEHAGAAGQRAGASRRALSPAIFGGAGGRGNHRAHQLALSKAARERARGAARSGRTTTTRLLLLRSPATLVKRILGFNLKSLLHRMLGTGFREPIEGREIVEVAQRRQQKLLSAAPAPAPDAIARLPFTERLLYALLATTERLQAPGRVARRSAFLPRAAGGASAPRSRGFRANYGRVSPLKGRAGRECSGYESRWERFGLRGEPFAPAGALLFATAPPPRATTGRQVTPSARAIARSWLLPATTGPYCVAGL